MMRSLLTLLDSSTRRVFAAISLACLAMLAFGLFLQYHLNIEPCPMCIVQRDAMLVVAIIAALTSASGNKSKQTWGALLVLISAVFGAFVAARQSWLQWYPPEIATCGRDFYGMIESFPLSRAIPMIFKGSGDCSKIDWTLLGGSIANWSFMAFTTFVVLALLIVWRKVRR
jgi:disulfide bond formation protein DsbB